MTHKYLIAWEKWVDPYGDNLDDIEWPGYKDQKDTTIQDEFNELLSDDTESPLLEEAKTPKPMRILATPMGIIPLTEYSLPGKVFNFWTGHTNFPITHAVKHVIEHTNGVETLDIFTQYRMRVGIGKLFASLQVKSDISERLNKFLNQDSKNVST